MSKSEYEKMREQGSKAAALSFDPFGTPAPKAPTPGPELVEVKPPVVQAEPEMVDAQEQSTQSEPTTNKTRSGSIADVDKTEQATSRSLAMLPSRHRQVKDMAYLEDRKPWQIIDDALELYVKKFHPKKK
jgi:hypothetical protein